MVSTFPSSLIASRQFRLLIALLPRRRRGLPLLWATYLHGVVHPQVTAFQLVFLEELGEIRAADLMPVFIGNRGFTRSAMLRCCPPCEKHLVG